MADAVFLVERYLPGGNSAALDALRARLRTVTAAMRREGLDVTWLHSIVVPDDDTCLCVFRAARRELVVEANARAATDWERISTAIAAGEL